MDQKTFSKLSTELQRIYYILWMLSTINECTTDDLKNYTELPSNTVWRLLNKLRMDYSVDVEFVRVGGGIGKRGYYEILDWGVFDQGRFFAIFDDFFSAEHGKLNVK